MSMLICIVSFLPIVGKSFGVWAVVCVFIGFHIEWTLVCIIIHVCIEYVFLMIIF
jgi:hypothetical protein